MRMFGTDGSSQPPVPELPRLPEPEMFQVITYDSDSVDMIPGHKVETPDSGGLNILLLVMFDGEKAGFKVSKFYAPGTWMSVEQLDHEPVEPSRIIH